MATTFRGKQLGQQGEEYSVNRRIRGGSFGSRLNPEIVNRQLNAKIGLPMPSPLVIATSRQNAVSGPAGAMRNRIEILADRFKK